MDSQGFSVAVNCWYGVKEESTSGKMEGKPHMEPYLFRKLAGR